MPSLTAVDPAAGAVVAESPGMPGRKAPYWQKLTTCIKGRWLDGQYRFEFWKFFLVQPKFSLVLESLELVLGCLDQVVPIL